MTMNFRKSIRWRLQAWYGALLLAVVAGFCFTAYRLERANALRRFDEELDTRVGFLSRQLTQGRPGDGQNRDEEWMDPENPPRRPPNPFESPDLLGLFDSSSAQPFYFQVWKRDGDLLEASPKAPAKIPLPARPGSGGDHGLREREGVRESYHFTPPGECLLVGRSTAELERELRKLALTLSATGLAVLAAGLGMGAWISARALRPIDDISAAASRIAAGNLKERIRTGETESELGRLASVLDDTFQKLDAAFEEQARFTSDAAHELRTPLSIILAQSQLALARERSAQDYRATIEVSERAARRMHGLVESLLQLAILEAGEGDEARATVDLADIAMAQAMEIAPLAGEKNIAIQQEAHAAPCSGNAGQLSQIAANLLGNAVKFSPTGARITVSTGGDDKEVWLCVADSGPGIEARHLPHLFERFYRADLSRSRVSGGAGLGLPICQRIAEAHGGRVEVESEPGKGSTFTLRLSSSRCHATAGVSNGSE